MSGIAAIHLARGKNGHSFFGIKQKDRKQRSPLQKEVTGGKEKQHVFRKGAPKNLSSHIDIGKTSSFQ